MIFRKKGFLSIVTFLFLSAEFFAFSLTDISSVLGELGIWQLSDNEGVTSFRTLLIPYGGRSESLGAAFTGLSDDPSYINYNAAASCIQKETQVALFHNSWLADSRFENLAYTTRYNNLGLGAQLGCFYVPFSEYNILGEKVAGSYYVEAISALNISYNFFSGYDFKGLALGASLKSAWRSVPDYTDNDTNALIGGSGLKQSGLGLMADLGVMLQFNFLKFFASRDPNVKIGFAAQNLGVAFTGFTGTLQLDDPLPTYVAAGISIQFLPVIILTADIKQPLNLQDLSSYQLFSVSLGTILDFTDFFNLLAGIEFKGGNPKISVGGEFEVRKLRLNFNYTLDLTSSINPVNRISLSARVMLGDRGRQQVQEDIDKLYAKGLLHYYNSEWEKAIEVWQQILEINPRYDPAITGIASAQSQIDMFQKVRNSMFFDE